MIDGLRLYLQRQASSFWRYVVEQTLFLLIGWVPTFVGMGLRGIFYRLILAMDGWAAVENGVRLRFADHIRLGNGVYLDQGAYRHHVVPALPPFGVEPGGDLLVAEVGVGDLGDDDYPALVSGEVNSTVERWSEEYSVSAFKESVKSMLTESALV